MALSDYQSNHPDACHICGRRATGIGLSPKPPHQWICTECVLILEDIKRVRRMDPFELKARAGGMEAAGTLIEEFGLDLSEYSEEQALMLCGAIWRGCSDRLRQIIREGEAPW